jgi:hypothetical protein
MLKSSEKQLVVETQETYEEQVVNGFDFPISLGAPQIGALILQ